MRESSPRRRIWSSSIVPVRPNASLPRRCSLGTPAFRPTAGGSPPKCSRLDAGTAFPSLTWPPARASDWRSTIPVGGLNGRETAPACCSGTGAKSFNERQTGAAPTPCWSATGWRIRWQPTLLCRVPHTRWRRRPSAMQRLGYGACISRRWIPWRRFGRSRPGRRTTSLRRFLRTVVCWRGCRTNQGRIRCMRSRFPARVREFRYRLPVVTSRSGRGPVPHFTIVGHPG